MGLFELGLSMFACRMKVEGHPRSSIQISHANYKLVLQQQFFQRRNYSSLREQNETLI